MPEKARIVSCPRCGKSTAWDTGNPYRPFCSKRCKLIDLGAWASETYRIAVTETKDSPDTDEPDAPG
ncbi:MAG: DNA gyrase inhibitor YacG [Betaproteobacteria bacterium]|nr:DNA gyrase inhibitor YacG [Betaproteobacteria bacterium]